MIGCFGKPIAFLVLMMALSIYCSESITLDESKHPSCPVTRNFPPPSPPPNFAKKKRKQPPFVWKQRGWRQRVGRHFRDRQGIQACKNVGNSDSPSILNQDIPLEEVKPSQIQPDSSTLAETQEYKFQMELFNNLIVPCQRCKSCRIAKLGANFIIAGPSLDPSPLFDLLRSIAIEEPPSNVLFSTIVNTFSCEPEWADHDKTFIISTLEPDGKTVNTIWTKSLCAYLFEPRSRTFVLTLQPHQEFGFVNRTVIELDQLKSYYLVLYSRRPISTVLEDYIQAVVDLNSTNHHSALAAIYANAGDSFSKSCLAFLVVARDDAQYGPNDAHAGSSLAVEAL